MRLARIFLGLLVLAIAALVVTCSKLSTERAKAQHWESNYKAERNGFASYRAGEDGRISAATVEAVKLERVRLSDLDAATARQIEALKLDNRRLKGVIAATYTAEVKVSAEERDSLAVRKDSLGVRTVDTLRRIEWATKSGDARIVLERELNDKRWSGTLQTYDSVLVVRHVVPKRFLFIRYGVRSERYDIAITRSGAQLTGFRVTTVRD